MSKSSFTRADPKLSKGTSKRKQSKFSNVGDFLSRIWSIYGPPDSINYEGFNYTFIHAPSKLTLTVYSAGSGPAYGGMRKDHELLLKVIEEFEQQLDESIPVDCQIEFDTDHGLVQAGYKSSKPFERLVES